MGSSFTLFLDADDIVYRFHTYLNFVLSHQYDLPVAPDFIPHGWDYQEVTPDLKTIFKDLPKKWPLMLEVQPGVRKFLTEIKNLNGKVVIITSLPTDQAPYRIEALIRDKIEFSEIYFTFQADKSEFIKALKGRHSGPYFFVDDYLKNCNASAAVVDKSFCYYTNYNIEHSPPQNTFMASSCEQMFHMIIDHIKGVLSNEK